MPVVGIKSKREDYRLVGVYLPPRVHDFLTLYTLAEGISKSSLFKMLIDDWVNDQKSIGSEKELLQKLGERANEKWHTKRGGMPTMLVHGF